MQRTVSMWTLSALALLSSVACSNFKRQQMYIQVVNNSGAAVRNVEVDYPGGTYGLPTLANDTTNRKLQAIGETTGTMPTGGTQGGCKFIVRFEDAQGKKYTSDWDFGQPKCPPEVMLNLGPDHKISGMVVQ